MPAKLFEEFPPVPTAQWEAAIAKDLKGADYQQRLVWRTRTGLAIKPYYRSEDLAGLDHQLDTRPGVFPYVRGTSAVNHWKIREEIDESGIGEANAAARAALNAGAEEVCFRRAVPRTLAELQALTAGLGDAGTAFWAEGPAAPLASLILESGLKLHGAMKLHPFQETDAAVAFLKQSPGPMFRPVAIRRANFLEAGATSIQEVGFLLAAGIDYLRLMTSRGVTVDQAAQGLCFAVLVGASYFFQIAKLRALRMLWARVVESFGGSQEAAKAYLFARTAGWNQSIYDPYNNVLRGTTEAMAAAIGGADSLAVGPFDETYRNAREASRRLARNTQIILKHEAYLDRVTDPAAGSYYVERLTASVAEAAWKLMQEVESIGGYLKARDAGMIPHAVREARKKAEEAVAMRRRVILGTNNYPNLSERMLGEIEPKDIELVYGRGANEFEDIRLRTERYVAAGHPLPTILLAEMGDLKMRMARSGFMRNFLGCAGFGIESGYYADVEAAAAKAAEAKAAAVVLCSSDDEYTTLAPRLAPLLGGVPLIVAGNPKNAVELNQAGVADFIHIKSNAVATLTEWQNRLGVNA